MLEESALNAIAQTLLTMKQSPRSSLNPKQRTLRIIERCLRQESALNAIAQTLLTMRQWPQSFLNPKQRTLRIIERCLRPFET
jgi:ABC-type dipeptide/oligopeptide/nickel transport system ATPase subunit